MELILTGLFGTLVALTAAIGVPLVLYFIAVSVWRDVQWALSAPYTWAAEKADMSELRRLLAKKPSPLRLSDAVFQAVWKNNIEVLGVLLESDWDLNNNTVMGAPALHVAVAHAKLETIKLVLAKGADPNCCGADGKALSPLLWAATAGRVDVIDLLLDAGANPKTVLLDDIGVHPGFKPPLAGPKEIALAKQRIADAQHARE